MKYVSTYEGMLEIAVQWRDLSRVVPKSELKQAARVYMRRAALSARRLREGAHLKLKGGRS